MRQNSIEDYDGRAKPELKTKAQIWRGADLDQRRAYKAPFESPNLDPDQLLQKMLAAFRVIVY